ncbi:hypothetical protein EV121DRAFT_266108 [Schizophyllum commune]
MLAHVSACGHVMVCHSPNFPPAGTQSQRAISSGPTSTRMTLRRPKNALEARNLTLAKPTSWRIHIFHSF